MRPNGSNWIPGDICARVVSALVLLGLSSAYASADDLLGLYAGGAVGQSRLEATGERTYASGNVYYDTGSFNENDTGFKVFVGIHPISLLGAEIAYVELRSSRWWLRFISCKCIDEGRFGLWSSISTGTYS